MNEQRRHDRTPSAAVIELSHDSIGTILVSSRDISGRGVFVFGEPGLELPPVGTILNLKITGAMGHEMPEVLAEVVRTDEDGIGICFLQELF